MCVLVIIFKLKLRFFNSSVCLYCETSHRNIFVSNFWKHLNLFPSLNFSRQSQSLSYYILGENSSVSFYSCATKNNIKDCRVSFWIIYSINCSKLKKIFFVCIYYSHAFTLHYYLCKIPDLASMATLPTEVGDGLEEQDTYSP